MSVADAPLRACPPHARRLVAGAARRRSAAASAAALAAALLLAGCGVGAGQTGADKVAGPRTDIGAPATGSGPAAGPGGQAGQGGVSSGGSAPGSAAGGAGGESGPIATGPEASVRVTPQPGQQNVHQVTVTSLTAQVAGGRLIAQAGWESGPAPCTVLDRVESGRQDNVFWVKLYEGGPSDKVCTAIVQSKSTDIDLGPVGPGNYDVVAIGPETSAEPPPRASVVVP